MDDLVAEDEKVAHMIHAQAARGFLDAAGFIQVQRRNTSALARGRIFPTNWDTMKLVAVLLTPILLTQCTLWRPGRAEGIDANPYVLLERQAKAENRDPSRIAVPMLRAPVLEKRWGKPTLLVGPKGGYLLRYQDPSDQNRFLAIYGTAKSYLLAGPLPPPYTDLGIDPETNTFNPREVNQLWSFAQVAGRTVRYYISEGPQEKLPAVYSTETFRMTAPDGREASYMLRASSKPKKKGLEVEDLFGSAAFAK
jgi:hypothetical protein